MATVERCWDEPSQDERVSALPVGAGAQSLTTETPIGVVEMVGRWNCFEVHINAPVSWLDVTFRCSCSIASGVLVPVDTVRLADLELPLVLGVGATARIQGVLFSIRGRPSNSFRVEAWRTAENHEQAIFSSRAWGGATGVHGDRARRLPVDLWGQLGQIRSFTTGLAGLAVGTTVAFARNPLPRGRVGLTRLEWTRQDAGGASLTLQEVSPAAVVNVRGVWSHRGAADPANIEPPIWVPPLYTLPEGRWELVLSAGIPANNLVNMSAIDD